MFFSSSELIGVLIIAHFLIIIALLIYLKKIKKTIKRIESKLNVFETKLETINIKVEDIETRFIFFTNIVRDELEETKTGIEKAREEVKELKFNEKNVYSTPIGRLVYLTEKLRNYLRLKIKKNREVS